MPLLKRRSAFDDPDWIFELKYDGFRAVARVERGRTELISRNGNTFALKKTAPSFVHRSLADYFLADRSSAS